MAFIDEHRDRFGGVEPIRRVLTRHHCSIAPSPCYAHKQRQASPSVRQVRDAGLKKLITRPTKPPTASTGPGKSAAN